MSKPIIVQSDKTVLLEVDNPEFQECRSILSRFSELEKSPEYLHTYRITTLSLWHAASMKMTSDEIIDCLNRYSKYKIPQNIKSEIKEQISRYGKVKLKKNEVGELFITADEDILLQEIAHNKIIQNFIEKIEKEHIIVKKDFRGHIKQALVKVGFPIEDLAGYDEGNKYGFNLREKTKKNKDFIIRDYQKNSISTFYTHGSIEGGSGVIVLPCGAGKTIVGIGVMQVVGAETLILVTNTLSIRQWKDEILDKTYVPPEDIGEYSGEVKEVKPITIATYNILTHRKNKESAFSHFYLFSARNWGLIIYDEVHLLPAPVFRMTSEIQAKRRLGLTATLVREDGLEEDVFSLIGPKKYDVPWKELENKSWIAAAKCIEIRMDMKEEYKMQYIVANEREKFRLASENPEKFKAIKLILEQNKNSKILIIGQYIQQLEAIAKESSIDLITGKTHLSIRQNLYDSFRRSEISALVLSKVANFSIDLPDANIGIQVSGSFGSRQEEAQRLGRILRPKEKNNQAIFYSIVSKNTSEERFGQNRQLFLTEQGYEYKVYTFEQFKENLKETKP